MTTVSGTDIADIIAEVVGMDMENLPKELSKRQKPVVHRQRVKPLKAIAAGGRDPGMT
jgi:hypothetical protein